MKKLIFYLAINLISFSSNSFAQQKVIDSLYKSLSETNVPDTTRVNRLNKLATKIGNIDKKQSDSLFRQAIDLASRSKNVRGEVRSLIAFSFLNRERTNFAASRQFLSQALQIAQKNQNQFYVIDAVNNFYQDYYGDYSEDYVQQLEYSLYYLKLAEQYNIPILIADACTNVGSVFALFGNYSRALDYQNRALKILHQKENANSLIEANALFYLAETYQFQGKYDEAIQVYKQSLQLAALLNSLVYVAENYSSLASVYERQKRYHETFINAFQALPMYTDFKDEGGISYITSILSRAYLNTNRTDSALIFGNHSLQSAQKVNNQTLLRIAHEVLSKSYAKEKDFKKAYFHYVMYTNYKDSLFNKANAQQAAYILYTAELSQKENKISLLENDKIIRVQEARRQKLLLYSMVIVISLILALMFVVVRSYRIKQRANALLEQQKEEIQNTLTELKSTQTQLIQREKMASLGELTAGIAHEIQNPLNFVNNFSEVNTELIEELKGERSKVKGRRNDELENELLNDISQNLEKIASHGKRADAIVKGMLQHSQKSTGQKEPTDINALTDEYLRLSYHGLRAKDKSFNATIETHFDESISKIEVIPQDIGRVLLNLFNNAFYAVTEKKKAPALKGENYEPTVWVITKKENDKVIIAVRDNGIGIPQKAVDKIFQPFFTTKPTGQGTGLGLSLSYDIIKAHGGDMKVNTKEGEFAEFIIELPAK